MTNRDLKLARAVLQCMRKQASHLTAEQIKPKFLSPLLVRLFKPKYSVKDLEWAMKQRAKVKAALKGAEQEKPATASPLLDNIRQNAALRKSLLN